MYTLGPAGVHAVLLIANAASANQATDNGIVVVGSDISSYVIVAEYAHPITVGGNFGSLFVAPTFGSIDGSISVGGQSISNTSGNVGDLTFGAMVGLVGMPALSVQDYVKYKPGFALTAVGSVVAPTGDYDSKRPFNLGANRWLVRAAFPMTYSVGESLVDPSLVTFEVMPSLTFASTNNDPYGADRQEQAPLLQIEHHVTRTLTPKTWVAVDGIYVYGARTHTDGRDDGNARAGYNLGGTAMVSLNATFQLRVSYARSIAHNKYAMQGQGVRVTLVSAF